MHAIRMHVSQSASCLSIVCATVLFVVGIVEGTGACKVGQQDSFDINRILEKQLINDCSTIYTLAGIFYENQEKPPNAVKVTYKIQIPDNSQCRSECSCWKDACSIEHCDPGNCCFEKVMLWGRIPMYVQDSIFRQLSMCSLVVGGVKEKSITIFLNITDDALLSDSSSSDCYGSQFPCSWCSVGMPEHLSANAIQSQLGIDTVITIAKSTSPLDTALLTLTAKVSDIVIHTCNMFNVTYKSHGQLSADHELTGTISAQCTLTRTISAQCTL